MSAIVAAANTNTLFSADIMEHESFQNMEKYDTMVRNALASGMSIEQAVDTADYEYNCADFSAEPVHLPYPVCIYIPRVRKFNTVEFVKEQLSFLGEIERVDFVRNKNFVTKVVDDQFKRAFVHIADIAPNSGNAARVFEAIDATGQYAFSPNTLDEIWYLHYADDTIENTELNIHQIAHNYNIMDDKLIDAEQKLFQHDVMLEQLHEKNDTLEEQVRELQKTTVSMQLYMDSLTQRIGELLKKPYPSAIAAEDDEDEDDNHSADSEFMLKSSRM